MKWGNEYFEDLKPVALLDNFTKEVYNMDGHAYCGGAIGFLIPYLETQFSFCK